MKNNILKNKSYLFALRIVKLSRYLVEGREYTLSKQVLRSGTSIGANIEEAFQGESKQDSFTSLLSLTRKLLRPTTGSDS
jgi:four helix bundle protein